MANRYAGHVETLEPAFVGWVVDRRRPSEPVRFTAIIDRACSVPILADRPRPDVTAAGFGGPNCGFSVTLPPSLFDGRAHDVELMSDDGECLALAGWLSPVVLGPLTADILPVTTADLDAVAALLRQTYRESGIDPEAVTDRYVAGWIAGAIGAGGLLLAARVEGRLAGYAMLERGRQSASTMGVVALSVLSLYRRKGLGERLMRALFAAVRDDGAIGEVWLSVQPENLPARRLYEKLGFVYRSDVPSSLVVLAGYLAMLWRLDPRNA